MKKKALILTILSSMTLAAGGLAVALGAGGIDFLGSKAGTAAPGTVSYSYTTVGQKDLGSYKYSFLKTTQSGTNIYFYSENNYPLYSKLVASFGGSSYASKFFTFTKDENGENAFTFQNVTSISVTTATTSSATSPFSIYTSKDATSPSYSGTINKGETKVITEIAGATYIKFVPTSTSFIDITEVTVNYSCDPEVDPGEKTLVGIRVKDDYKKNYAQGSEFVEPTVYAQYVQDDEPSEEIVTTAEFSGYDKDTLGVQTITASFGGKTTQFDINVKPTEVSKLISYKGFSHTVGGETREISDFLDVENSNLPAYGEPGEVLSFTPVFKSGFTYYDAYEENYHVENYNYNEGVVSFTVPTYYDVDTVIVFEEALTLESMRVENPKTEYTVGSSFVIPTVVGVYSNPNDEEFEFNLSVDSSNFSGFDSSATVTSQTITVSYPGVQDVTYTISIVESKGGISGTFSYGSSTKWQFVFNDDLTGEYKKVGSTGSTLATETFSYTLTDSHINIYDVVISGSSTWTTDWFLTKCLDTTDKYKARETENDTGTYNETTFTIYTYNTTTEKATLRTFTKI